MNTTRHQEPPEVVCIGLNVVDVLVRLPAQVRPGEKHAVDELRITGGAPAGNAACVLATLGHNTAFLGRLGDDTLSQIARAELQRCGVRTDHLIADPGARPAVAVVEIDPATAERTVFYSLAGYAHLSADDVPHGLIRSARMVLVDGYERETALRALALAQEHGVRSVLDAEAGDADTLRTLIERATDAILPLAAAQAATGQHHPAETVAALACWTAGQVVVTDGVAGSWAAIPGGVIHQPAFPVTAADTTGCGDAFHAAYAAALLADQPLTTRLAFAAFYASRVALVVGGRTALPNFAQLADALSADADPSMSRFIHSKASA